MKGYIMLVLIRSGPDTSEGRRGLRLARDMAADIVLIQNGVYFALDELLDGYCGTAYAIAEDMDMRDIRKDEVPGGLKRIGWDELLELMAEDGKVTGMF